MKPPDSFRHGISGYSKHRCRCDVCREAKSAAMRRYRDNKRFGTSPGRRQPPQHGTRACYKNCRAGPGGTKCEPCRAANRDYQREYMWLWRQGISLRPAWED